jgi:hypothetical protein
MKAAKFKVKLDECQGNVLEDLGLVQTRCPEQEHERVNVAFPAWMVIALDREARRLGVTR